MYFKQNWHWSIALRVYFQKSKLDTFHVRYLVLRAIWISWIRKRLERVLLNLLVFPSNDAIWHIIHNSKKWSGIKKWFSIENYQVVIDLLTWFCDGQWYSHPAFLPSFTLITCPSIFYLWIDFLFFRTPSFKA